MVPSLLPQRGASSTRGQMPSRAESKEGGVNMCVRCECCGEENPEDTFDEEGWCKVCADSAKSQADYRAWVNRGG